MSEEKIERYICYAECIIEHEEKYLLILRPQGSHAGGLLAFPGGKIEHSDGHFGQDIFLNAAKREVMEEVGINLNAPLQYITSNFFYDDRNYLPVVGCVFHCRLNGPRPAVIPNLQEVPEFYWLTFNEINSHLKTPEWVKRYLKMLKK